MAIWTLSQLFPRATELSECCTVVDTVSNRLRTVLHSPIRARAENFLVGCRRSSESACWRVSSAATTQYIFVAYRLIDLISSSSIDPTYKVFTESFVLTLVTFSYCTCTPFTEAKSDEILVVGVIP